MLRFKIYIIRHIKHNLSSNFLYHKNPIIAYYDNINP